MKRILALALGVAFATAATAHEREARDYDLSCRATHEISCNATSCESTAGDSIHVGLGLITREGVGNMCTYTYCREFMLVPNPGDTVGQAVERWTGFTLSTSRGSTEEHIGRPAIDYQLSVSEDRTRFVLGGAENGGFGGWAGVCEQNPDYQPDTEE
jgi:hypothetical protein